MNLYRMLLQREADDEPLRVGLIGAGKFGSMFLSQVRKTTGMHLLAVADLRPDQARESLKRVGFKASDLKAKSFEAALRSRQCFVTDDAMALIKSSSIDIVIDATGSPAAGIQHVLACCEYGKHIVMVNVEADALAGPLLARKAAEAGIVYSLAYGDQPALICEMVDWARASGFEVIAAGKGTKYLSNYHQSTPATVWSHYGISEADAKLGGMNAQMFNSFWTALNRLSKWLLYRTLLGFCPRAMACSFRLAVSMTWRACCDRDHRVASWRIVVRLK